MRPTTSTVPTSQADRVYFFGTGIDMRAPAGFQSGCAWFRLLLPVVPGVAPSPMSRAVAAADFGLGISSHGEWPPRLAYPNADLVVHTARPLEGEWVRVEASSVWRDNGIGLCTMTLADPQGAIGAAEPVPSPLAHVLKPAKPTCRCSIGTFRHLTPTRGL